jgi:hypothetical protein
LRAVLRCSRPNPLNARRNINRRRQEVPVLLLLRPVGQSKDKSLHRAGIGGPFQEPSLRPGEKISRRSGGQGPTAPPREQVHSFPGARQLGRRGDRANGRPEGAGEPRRGRRGMTGYYSSSRPAFAISTQRSSEELPVLAVMSSGPPQCGQFVCWRSPSGPSAS